MSIGHMVKTKLVTRSKDSRDFFGVSEGIGCGMVLSQS